MQQRRLVDYLAGQHRRDGGVAEGPLRLITITEEAGKNTSGNSPWVNLIHETLIRSKGVDAVGKPQPYWPTLWSYIEENKGRAERRERLGLLAQGNLGMLFGSFGLAEARDQIEKRRKTTSDLDNQIRELEKQLVRKQNVFEKLLAEAKAQPPLVFLSYAREDAPFVMKLSMHLKENGIRTWIDTENLLPGQKWKNTIQKAIQTADFVVLCMSRNSVTKRGFIHVEQKWALETADHSPPGDIYVIPARIEDCPIPDIALEYHCVDIYSKSGMDKLLETIIIEWAKRQGLMAPKH